MEKITKKQRDVRFERAIMWVFALFVMISPVCSAAEQMTVFAASSLRDALTEMSDRHTDESGVEVVLVFAASSSIARQVALGAPADVVLLADQDWANWLIEKGALAQGTAFAGNRLVVIGRDIAPLETPEDILAILGDGKLAMAQVDAVPAGRYGKSALVSLGIWGALEPQVVQAANVRAALHFVQRGEAPLAIGYASDLVALPELSTVYEFAEDAHPQIVYSGGTLTDQGADFMTFLLSPSGQSILNSWGFSPAPNAP